MTFNVIVSKILIFVFSSRSSDFIEFSFKEPTISPAPCQMQSIDPYTVYFSWNVIPNDKVPGRFLGYRIFSKKKFENQTSVVYVESSVLQRTVRTFEAFTWYWVEIAGYSNGGIGPSCVFVFKTPPGGK